MEAIAIVSAGTANQQGCRSLSTVSHSAGNFIALEVLPMQWRHCFFPSVHWYPSFTWKSFSPESHLRVFAALMTSRHQKHTPTGRPNISFPVVFMFCQQDVKHLDTWDACGRVTRSFIFKCHGFWHHGNTHRVCLYRNSKPLTECLSIWAACVIRGRGHLLSVTSLFCTQKRLSKVTSDSKRLHQM